MLYEIAKPLLEKTNKRYRERDTKSYEEKNFGKINVFKK